jgi:hypothetical protein
VTAARVALATLLALAALAAPAAAEPVTETADAGTVHAEFTYDRTTDEYDVVQYTSLHVRITDNGAPVVDEAIPDDAFLQPGGFGDRKSISAADLDGDGTVEVVLDLYTGGAHCCFDSWIYHGAAKTVREWGDVGYRFKDFDGDGRPEFLSADPAFSAAFTSFAASRFPLQVLAWRTDRLQDITRSAPVRPRLRREAKNLHGDYSKLNRRFRRGHHDIGTRERIRATLAAYAADSCSLGSCRRGSKLIATARRHREVPKGFAREVRKVLRAGGYLG